MPPNFVLLDATLPDVTILVAAMLQAREAVDRRSWSHPQEPTGEAWWADVLADPRARKRERRTDLAVKQAFYRLADEKRETILVACSKGDWRAAFSRDDLIATHVAHSEEMRGLVDREVIDKQLRSPEALTMALLGLMAEDCLIRQRLSKAIGKRRSAEAA
jgi:hypothetical protein